MAHVLGLFHIMDKKENFGHCYSECLSVGDIVEWSSWDQASQDWEYNYGIITKIKNELRSNRLVSISTVAPFQGPKKEIEHFSLSLRLVSKTGKEDDVNS